MHQVTPEQVLEEMHQTVTELVDWLSTGGGTRQERIRKTADFLGISVSQAKCFVYRQAGRVDAHVADTIRIRARPVLEQIRTVKATMPPDYLKGDGFPTSGWSDIDESRGDK